MSELETIDILLTAAFGLEAVVKREVSALGYEAQVIQPGRLLVRAGLEAVARLNLWVRTAERVLIRVGEFPADDFGLLFEFSRYTEFTFIDVIVLLKNHLKLLINYLLRKYNIY